MGVSHNGWLMENPIEMDENWGYPYFRKPPYIGNVIIPTDSFFQRGMYTTNLIGFEPFVLRIP